MGFEGEIADIEGFEDQIKEAAKALKQINFDTLKEEMKSTQELVKDIEGREDTERKFTEEEMNKMVKANPELAS
jgi:C4-type Zn-finger protein